MTVRMPWRSSARHPSRAQLLEGVGADERAAADAAEAAEVADVDAAVPAQVSFHRAKASARPLRAPTDLD